MASVGENIAAIVCPCCGWRLVKTPLTPTQQRALDFIKAYRGEHKVSPTYQEICDGLGYASRSRVHALVEHLLARGALLRGPRDSKRTLMPTDEVAA